MFIPFGSSESPPGGRLVMPPAQRSRASASYAQASAPRWLRRLSLAVSGVFGWMALAALPAQCLAHPAALKRDGVRVLTAEEMTRLVGQQAPPHQLTYSAASGPTYPWEGSYGGVNTGNGNKLTGVTLFGWTQRGGLPVTLTLNHNSQSNHFSELGGKWTFSFDIYGVIAPTTGNCVIHWGDDLSYQFTQVSPGVYQPLNGVQDTFVVNVDGSATVTKPSQVQYHFDATNHYCDTITDENGNTITIARNAGGYITSVTDATSRAIVFHYDANNHIDTITDPLSRVWTLGYVPAAGGTYDLAHVQLPALAGNPTTYGWTFAPTSSHNIATLTSPGGRQETYTYYADSSLATETDGCGNQSSYSYANGQTVITDANGHTTTHNYATGRLSSAVDQQSNTVTPTYDTSNNKTTVQDERGKNSVYTYDSRGNVLTAKDPLLNTTVWTYNSHNKALTKTLPTGEQTVYSYDTLDNLTGVAHKDSLGTTQASESYTVDTHGLVTDAYDANSHHTQYGHSANGDLTSVTTPNSHVTTFGVNGIGVRTSRQDALLRTTTYTLDNWNRVTTATYPNTSTKTFQYDADSNLTQFVDASGTTTRVYDNDARLTSESKGGSTVVSHTYDATGKLGLLSTTSDANSRVLTFAYDSLNRLYTVSETAGTTTYGYDNAGHETSIANANATTVTKVYDDAGQVTSVVNKNSTGTTLSSFSYVYDTDNRRHTCTEASGDVVTYGYDWGGRLTSESRTGTNAYSLSYTLDGVGNRTSQTKGTATTSFTLDSDDELTATSSSTGGFVNSYGYNANGEQTSRTLSGTAYTLAYDYDGQITSMTQGSTVVSFTYDGLGRRNSRTAGGTTTNFLYDDDEILLEKQGSSFTATYAYGNGLVRKDGETPLFDDQGSERTVTNSSQTVIGTLTLDGFGNTVTSTGSSSNPYMYAATARYRNDGDAGLTHVGARYYDAQVGRFITRDTELDQHPYLYCDHDPVNYTDPSGHKPPKQNSKPHPKPKLPYPFDGIKELQVQIGVQGGVNAVVQVGGSASATVIVDMKAFWDHQTPYKDQQNLSHRPFNDYIQYVRDRVKVPTPKTGQK